MCDFAEGFSSSAVATNGTKVLDAPIFLRALLLQTAGAMPALAHLSTVYVRQFMWHEQTTRALCSLQTEWRESESHLLFDQWSYAVFKWICMHTSLVLRLLFIYLLYVPLSALLSSRCLWSKKLNACKTIRFSVLCISFWWHAQDCAQMTGAAGFFVFFSDFGEVWMSH